MNYDCNALSSSRMMSFSARTSRSSATILVILLSCSLFLWRTSDALMTTPRNYGRILSPQLEHRWRTAIYMASFNKKQQREAEIRRKILQLKKAGKMPRNRKTNDDDDILEELRQEDLEELSDLEKLKRNRARMMKSPSVTDDYGSRIKKKLGDQRATYLGLVEEDDDDDDDDDDLLDEVTSRTMSSRKKGQLGSLSPSSSTEEVKEETEYNVLNPALFDFDEEEDEDDAMDEEDLVQLVAAKLKEKRRKEEAERDAGKRERIEQIAARIREQEEEGIKNGTFVKSTTGVGGNWIKNETAFKDTYKPRPGWGYFERPKDISKAYGGGRRIGRDIPPRAEDTERRKSDEETTKQLLSEYRRKMGIEVQSEKDHEGEINEALRIASLAMQRGIYATAVSALEKVTKYCSSNSKVGGNVFLELAMAYEANGRTDEAIAIYKQLSKCRIEDIKFNAKKLLYGIEAIGFMRDEAKSKEFSRKKIRNTFIDTTGLADFASNFDDRYMTGYIDLSNNKYRELTASVVRSYREARQVLLRAVNSGVEPRLKIIQALRSISRRFDDALEMEEQETKVEAEPVAVMNGKPILELVGRKTSTTYRPGAIRGLDEFMLMSPEQMMENLNGEWRLQLLADRKGDGVKFYNQTLSWQQIETTYSSGSDGEEEEVGDDEDKADSFPSMDGSFRSYGKAGFMTVAETGCINFDGPQRILHRTNVETSNGVMGKLFPDVGAASSLVPQQVVAVDSVLLITRCATKISSKRPKDEVKDYYAVWRRVEAGTYSESISA